MPIAPITIFLLVASILLAITVSGPFCWIPFGLAVILDLAVPKNLALVEE